MAEDVPSKISLKSDEEHVEKDVGPKNGAKGPKLADTDDPFKPTSVRELEERKIISMLVKAERQRQMDTYKRSIILPSCRKFSTHPFCTMTVEHICYRVFNYYLHKKTKFPGPDLCFVISTTIRDTIKRCLFERFKSVVLVDMIEKPVVNPRSNSKRRSRPSFISGYRMQCDIYFDKAVTYTWENRYMAASAVVFGFFVE